MPTLDNPSQSLYQSHKIKWENCQRCPLKDVRSKVVLARGQLPCNVLFIGDAPGVSDDVIGQPFKGPPGKLLDEIIRQSVPKDLTWAMTHLIGCIPLDPDHPEKAKTFPPPVESILACKPRLKEIIHIASPWLIVCVGSTVKSWILGLKKPNNEAPTFSDDLKLTGLNCVIIDILHPGEIVRAKIAQKTLMVKRCIASIAAGCDEIPPF